MMILNLQVFLGYPSVIILMSKILQRETKSSSTSTSSAFFERSSRKGYFPLKHTTLNAITNNNNKPNSSTNKHHFNPAICTKVLIKSKKFELRSSV